MKKAVLGAVFALSLTYQSLAVVTAVEVIDYTAGTGVGAYTDPTAALGVPGSIVGAGTGFDSVLSPFNPHFQTSELSRIGAGGQLTLRLENYALVGAGLEIGIFKNFGLVDTNWPNGVANATASGFGADSVQVSVSADNVAWVSLGVLNFNMFTNYWTDLSDPYSAANGTVAADFGKPYEGSVADFATMNYAQIVAQLNGSAGGTWLDLSGTGLSQVGFIRFNLAPGATNTFELNAVTVNNTLAGASVVPEPGTWALLLLGLGLLAGMRTCRKAGSTLAAWPLLGGLAVFSTASSPAQVVTDFGDIQFWAGSGSNQAALVIDWNDGKTVESYVWGFRWNGNATGWDMLNAIANADALLEWNGHPAFPTAVYSVYYDADADGGGYVYTNPQDFGGTEAGFANDTNDHYEEGWFTGYWAYWATDGTSPYEGGSWSSSFVGLTDRDLVNGSWDGLSFDADGFGGLDPAPGLSIAAVPEPSAFGLAALGLAGLGWIRRRRA